MIHLAPNQPFTRLLQGQVIYGTP